MIDPHVHLRDWNESYKETILHGLETAWECGIDVLFDMPNTSPALTGRESVLRRIGPLQYPVASSVHTI